jgi:hypothetical protein
MNACPSCGSPFEPDAKFCGLCGAQLVEATAAPPQKETDVYIRPGFSVNETDPTVIELRKMIIRSNLRAGFLFSLIIAVIVFLIWASGEGQVTPSCFLAGGVAGAITFLLSIPFYIKAKMERDWEGTIVKTKEKISYESRPDDEYDRRPSRKEKYIIKVKLGTLKYKKLTYGNYQVLNYYHKGDQIKGHRNFKYPEKEDKSRDEHLRCIYCFTANEKTSDYCKNCNVALMK